MLVCLFRSVVRRRYTCGLSIQLGPRYSPHISGGHQSMRRFFQINWYHRFRKNYKRCVMIVLCVHVQILTHFLIPRTVSTICTVLLYLLYLLLSQKRICEIISRVILAHINDYLRWWSDAFSRANEASLVTEKLYCALLNLSIMLLINQWHLIETHP